MRYCKRLQDAYNPFNVLCRLMTKNLAKPCDNLSGNPDQEPLRQVIW